MIRPSPLLYVNTSPLVRATLRALSSPDNWQPGTTYGRHQHIKVEGGDDSTVIAVPQHILADFLTVYQRPSLLLKVFLALDSLALKGRTDLTLPALCDAIGYARKTGAHRPAAQAETWAAARVVLTLEIVDNTHVGIAARRRITGPLWNPQFTERSKNGGQYVPASISFRHGLWLEHKDARQGYGTVGSISDGLLSGLSLRKNDVGAVRIGAYLALLGRVRGYQSGNPITAQSILEAAGMSAPNRRQAEARADFEQAMNRLAEVGVIGCWRWVDPQAADTSPNAWRRCRVIVEWSIHPPEQRISPPGETQSTPRRNVQNMREKTSDCIDNNEPWSAAAGEPPTPSPSKNLFTESML